tara:strand:+ start:53 stop:688 length:636 start_codon:yes stop_codon:yes gene_type:complete
MADAYFVNNDLITARNIEGKAPVLPRISTELDSVRAYQWEISFFFGREVVGDLQKPLTLAAKQVNGVGFQVEDIEVNRVNDKVYFPGRPSMDELVVTFDNLQKARIDKLLYEVMSTSYDPRTGILNNKFAPNTDADTQLRTDKCEIQIAQLNGDGLPRNVVRLFGCYPKKLTHGEYNYSTNEFHTIEMSFRYDYFVNTNNKTGKVDFDIEN